MYRLNQVTKDDTKNPFSGRKFFSIAIFQNELTKEMKAVENVAGAVAEDVNLSNRVDVLNDDDTPEKESGSSLN